MTSLNRQANSTPVKQLTENSQGNSAEPTSSNSVASQWQFHAGIAAWRRYQ